MAGLELWGGIECTIARIGDTFRNQLAETGHWDRFDDLGLIASLGIRTIRYPTPVGGACAGRGRAARFQLDRRAPGRAARARHRASSPACFIMARARGTPALLDPDFPREVRRLCRRRSRRAIPWIKRWTPINEPLTTARFSCLYGHWYPHRRDYPILPRPRWSTSAEATAAAMAAIRARHSGRRAGPDRGSRPHLRDAAAALPGRHDNERRWLSLDLLCGRVGRAPSDAAAFSPKRASRRTCSMRSRRRRRRPTSSASTIT